jgi:molybdopterin converting factor small subunit
MEIPVGMTVQELKDHISREYPSLEESLPTVVIAVNREFAFDDTVIPELAEVAFFPPVSGG